MGGAAADAAFEDAAGTSPSPIASPMGIGSAPSPSSQEVNVGSIVHCGCIKSRLVAALSMERDAVDRR